MKGLQYQLKSILKDKFCLMTFLLPIAAAAVLNFAGSIDLSALAELHFGVLEENLSSQTVTWLCRYGSVEIYETREALTAAIHEPSTNVIGVEAEGQGIRTIIAGDELDVFQEAARTLPSLYEQREAAAQTEVLLLERADIMMGLQGIFIPAVLVTAMFMGCTFNAMNIISEKEDGVAFVNEILPIAPSQYMLQKIMAGFLCGCLSSVVTACICFRLSWQSAGGVLILIVLSSFVSALTGLFIGRFSDSLMAGVACIKSIMLILIAVPILCALIGVNGPLAVLCYFVPSHPAFEGIMALSSGAAGTAVKDMGILAVHCSAWSVLYVLISARCYK